MQMDEIIESVRELDGAHVMIPAPGDEAVPEVAWGDAFFYYAPDGRVPQNVQPYATIVTKNYPDDEQSDLDPADRWRVNVHVDRAAFRELTGEDPGQLVAQRTYSAPDTVMPHPVYGQLGWIAVVNPGEATSGTIMRLLREAHEAARARYERRHSSG
jgi:hypothetical protein